jgi:hypothetical protein
MHNILALAMLLALAGLTACAAPEEPVRRVELSGRVVAPEGVSGPVQVRVYHAWALTGELRHPLEFITEFPVTGEQFQQSFDYPLATGEGLAVYAWMDVDGDGVLCTPGDRRDLSGLTARESLSDGPVTVDVTLTDACRGPEWFYPPAPG